MSQNKVVVLSEDELEQLVFKAASKACSNLYDGLAQRFFYNYDDQLRMFAMELEEIKLRNRQGKI